MSSQFFFPKVEILVEKVVIVEKEKEVQGYSFFIKIDSKYTNTAPGSLNKRFPGSKELHVKNKYSKVFSLSQIEIRLLQALVESAFCVSN